MICYPIEVNGKRTIFSPINGVDTQEDLDIARIAMKIENLAKELAAMVHTNYISTVALAEQFRKEK